MTLEAGKKLGPYEIIEQAGAGGMGEVYKAKDTRLERIVAIKILPPTVSNIPDLRQRFEREAKTISSLNHPNICTLYDIGREDDIDFLVMEFIEGETLSEKIGQGPISMQEFLEISIQIADALDKAHRQGLIHRDLKPGNIMLTKSGAKLLDFGLAKLQMDSSNPGVQSITQTTPLTGAGTLLGTMQYMAPEQLEGKEADIRSDIFAFGAVMYEMATGAKAFSGGSQASLIASIIKEEPRSVSEIQPQLPPILEQTITQCLSKDPEQRWQSAGDLKRSLQWIADGKFVSRTSSLIPQNRSTRETITMAGMICFILALAVVSYFYWQKLNEPKQLIMSHVLAPDGYEFDEFAGGGISLSPDGEKLAFIAMDTVTHKNSLWVRSLNSLTALPLPGTAGAYLPFWSYDNRYIAFFIDGKLKKILATGGPTMTICDAVSGRDGDWNKDDVIIFTPTYNGTIHKVSAAGGEAVPITKLDTLSGDKTHRWVKFLPDGNHFLFYARTGTSDEGEKDAICLASLDSDNFKRIIPASSTVYFANGYILYQRESSLMAHPFDVDALEIIGDAFPIAENITFMNNWSRSVFTASNSGKIVYRSGDLNIGSLMLLMDREGKVIDTLGEQHVMYTHTFSPDEQTILFNINDVANSNIDLWLFDVNRKIQSRFTFDSTMDISGIWSPDGKQVAFRSDRSGKPGIYIKNVSGLGEIEKIYEHDSDIYPRSWSPDGKYILIDREDSKTLTDIWIIPLSDDKEPYPFLNSPFEEYDPAFSPDGRWIAYGSEETGLEQVYVTPFPGPGSKWQVSTKDGDRPRWREDGKEIIYLTNDDDLYSVDVDGTTATFRVGKERKLFNIDAARPGTIYDMTKDAQRFIINHQPQNSAKGKVVLVNNWNAELEQ